MNPDSLVRHPNARVEPSLAEAVAEVPYQFERQGYFVRDNQLEGLVFNRAVSLKDGWRKPNKAPAPEPKKAKPIPASDDDKRARKRRARSEVLAELHAADPELASRMTRYISELGLSEGDAQTLTSDRALSDLYESAIAAHSNPQGIANWVVNAVQAAIKDGGVTSLKFGGEEIAELVALIDEGTVSSKGAKKVFSALETQGGSPTQLVETLGLSQLNDPDQLRALVAQAIADNPGQLAQYQGGNTRLFGFFVGAVLRASGGRANPETVNQLLKEALD
jgi:glutaminyl-tRNA synthetase